MGIISHISVLEQPLIDPEICLTWILEKLSTKCDGKLIKCRQNGEAAIKIDRITETWMKSRLYSLCPSKIWFTKNFIENKFEDGRRSLPRTFSKLLHGKIDIDDMKQIKVFHRNRKWRVLDGNHSCTCIRNLRNLVSYWRLKSLCAHLKVTEHANSAQEQMNQKQSATRELMKLLRNGRTVKSIY